MKSRSFYWVGVFIVHLNLRSTQKFLQYLHNCDCPLEREVKCQHLIGWFNHFRGTFVRFAGEFFIWIRTWVGVRSVFLCWSNFCTLVGAYASNSHLNNMVKTRSQQKIPFPKRKTKSERKSVGKSLDGESKATSCCIASLARVCWEKPKG